MEILLTILGIKCKVVINGDGEGIVYKLQKRFIFKKWVKTGTILKGSISSYVDYVTTVDIL